MTSLPSGICRGTWSQIFGEVGPMLCKDWKWARTVGVGAIAVGAMVLTACGGDAAERSTKKLSASDLRVDPCLVMRTAGMSKMVGVVMTPPQTIGSRTCRSFVKGTGSGQFVSMSVDDEEVANLCQVGYCEKAVGLGSSRIYVVATGSLIPTSAVASSLAQMIADELDGKVL
jgi:hypothetical protein